MALVASFAFGTTMCCLTIVLLCFPGMPLDALWRFNPEAKEAFGSMGAWAYLLMFVVGAACAASAIGLARRSEWGRRLAMTVLIVNLLGDAIGAVLRNYPRSLGRVSTTNIHGFQGYWTFGHTRARYFPPENGGLVPQGAELGGGVFRIDHDQAFQSTANLRYQRKNAEYIAWTWRYDSGLVVSGVPDVAAALALTANQQTSIGFSCNGVFATPNNPITVCNVVGRSTLLTLPQMDTGDPDHNPDRVKPRNVFNLAIGTDNLLHTDGYKRITASVEFVNLTDKVALYNFLSTFSGTHFLGPRTTAARLGFSF